MALKSAFLPRVLLVILDEATSLDIIGLQLNNKKKYNKIMEKNT